MNEEEVVATIHIDPLTDSVGPLEQCSMCGRYIDRICSTCPRVESTLLPPSVARKRHAELREQNRRERAWYERGAR